MPVEPCRNYLTLVCFSRSFVPVEVASVAVSPGNLPRGPLDLSTPIIKAQEDIGSCSKCRKSSVAGRILRRSRTGRRGVLGRQAKRGGRRPVVGNTAQVPHSCGTQSVYRDRPCEQRLEWVLSLPVQRQQGC